MKFVSTLIPLLALVACTSSDDKPTASKPQAKRAAIETTRALARAAKSSNSNLAASVHYSGPCQTSGSLDVDGTFDGSDDGLVAKLDVSAKFNACTLDADTLDGDIAAKLDQNGADLEASLTGDLDWTGADGAASCAFNIHIKASATSYELSGSVCGYDLDDLDLDIDDLDIDWDF